MNNNPDFSIGFSTNLVRGLNPNWQPQKGLLNILYSVEHQAMDLRPVEPVNSRCMEPRGNGRRNAKR